VLKPVTIPTPSSLVAIWANNRELNFNAPGVSWPRFEEIRDQSGTFASVGISAFDNFTLTGDRSSSGDARPFETLGILPAVG
jgi:hypothetical protein